MLVISSGFIQKCFVKNSISWCAGSQQISQVVAWGEMGSLNKVLFFFFLAALKFRAGP